jgi:cob(I)alamin adenosyltransferase
MSITTRHGDAGQTRLLFGAAVEKSHPVIHAVGDVDELNAVLGLARLHVHREDVRGIIARAQEDLVALMGELSAGAAGAARYAEQGFRRLTQSSLERVTAEAAALEAEFPEGFRTWSVPGASGDAGSAWLELARCVCRRAERAAAAAQQDGGGLPVALAWLNRLSDLLWLAARCEETRAKAQA